jgi:hypothetical protein
VLYLVRMATGVFAEVFVRGSLVVRGDPAQTAQNIIDSERFFRPGSRAMWCATRPS